MPEFGSPLLPDAEVIEFVAIKSSVVNIQQKKATEMTNEEVKSVECLLISDEEKN